MKKEPLVSVIIPTYKRSETLGRAIDSALNQTYENVEIVVVDDNDPKSDFRKTTSKFMQKEYGKNKKVVYIKRSENGGGAKARNTGIMAAKGEYVTFLDDDDDYLKNKIEKQVEKMNDGYDMIFSDLIIKNNVTSETIISSYKENFSYDKKGLLKKHFVDVISGTPTFMYRRKKLIEIGMFHDIDANQEYVLMLNTILSGMKIGYLHEALCTGYIHDSDIRISNGPKAVMAKIKVIQLVKPYLKMIDRKDRRKTMYRLYAFVFYQSIKRKMPENILKYGLKLVPYLDLLVISRFQKKNKPKENIVYK